MYSTSQKYSMGVLSVSRLLMGTVLYITRKYQCNLVHSESTTSCTISIHTSTVFEHLHARLTTQRATPKQFAFKRSTLCSPTAWLHQYRLSNDMQLSTYLLVKYSSCERHLWFTYACLLSRKLKMG